MESFVIICCKHSFKTTHIIYTVTSSHSLYEQTTQVCKEVAYLYNAHLDFPHTAWATVASLHLVYKDVILCHRRQSGERWETVIY